MSDGAITTITILLFIFVLSAFIWPIALGIHLELEGRKKRGEPPAYDERQKLARLRAGSRAMYALLFFLVLWAIIDQTGWFDWTASILDMVLCALMLTWCVWASDCILHDGLIGWKEKRNSSDTFALTYTTTLLLISNSFRSSGVTDSWLPFIFAVADEAVLCAAVLYKYRKEKCADREEDAV